MTKILPALMLLLSGQYISPGFNKGAGGATPWTLKNSARASGSSVSTLATTSFSSPLTNPSVILCGIQFSSGQTTSSVTDTAGNTYSDSGQGSVAFNTSGQLEQLFVASNTHTTSSNAVTATFSASTAFARIDCAEFAGGIHGALIDIAVKTPVNQFSGTAGANNITVGPGTTTANGDLIYVAVGTITNNITAGTSPIAFTLIGTPTGGNGTEWFSQTTAAAITPTAGDVGTSDPYAAIFVAIKP